MGIHAQQSYVEENFVNSASPVFDEKIIATTSSSANASINLPHGEDPVSPEDGDLWTTTSGLYVQINEETVGPLGSGGGGGSGDIFYQSASPVAPSIANIWIDSDETPITLNTNDFMPKSGGIFNGNVSVLGIANFTSAKTKEIIIQNDFIDGPSLSSPSENINLWYYDGLDFSVASQETNPTGIFFKPDGTRFYITGTTGDDITEYSMSTPWDISTAIFVQESVDLGEATPQELFFRPDGEKVYVVGSTGDTVREFNLTVAWDVSTLTFFQEISVASEENTPTGLAFKSDGTKMYIVGTQNDRVSEWNLSTPWDVSTATLLQSFSVQDLEPNPGSVDFNSAGTKMWVSGTTGDYIYEFDLGTAWDVSTATYFGRTYVGFQELTPAAVWVQLSQGKAWVLGQTSDRIFEYKTNGTGLYLNSKINYIEGQTEFDDPVFFASPFASRSTIRIEGVATFASNASVAGTLTGSGAVTFSTTTGAINIATSQTTGATIVGGTTQTGAITVGRSTGAQTLNFGTGATADATTKTINIGTAGLAGSTTNINIGSSVSGALGAINLNLPLTSPKITSNSSINDSNNNELIKFPSVVTSAVNELSISNAATGQPVLITTTGNDTNIGLTITTKGTGSIIIDTGTGAGEIDLKPGASNLRVWDDDSSHYYQFVTGNRTANYNITLPAGNVILQTGTMAITEGNLSQFAATTSSQLAGVISDETGSGALVFATSPTLVTPNIGVATGTSFNSITGLSSTNPTMSGTVAVGTGTTVARADHVHPSDTSRAALTGATFTGVVTGVSPTAAGSIGFRRQTMSTAAPSGGLDGDVWLRY
jgi:hypothetical protein